MVRNPLQMLAKMTVCALFGALPLAATLFVVQATVPIAFGGLALELVPVLALFVVVRALLLGLG